MLGICVTEAGGTTRHCARGDKGHAELPVDIRFEALRGLCLRVRVSPITARRLKSWPVWPDPTRPENLREGHQGGGVHLIRALIG